MKFIIIIIIITERSHLVWKPDESGFLVVAKHPIFGIQQLLHDQEEKLFPDSSSINCIFSHKDHLQWSPQDGKKNYNLTKYWDFFILHHSTRYMAIVHYISGKKQYCGLMSEY